MAREGSKRQIAIDIMTANSDKAMADVLPIIMAECGLKSLSAARGYYKNLCENFGVPGKVESTRSPAKPKAAKKVSVPATKKARIAADAAPAETKSAAEIESIRAANLAKIREVHQRMIAQGKLPNTLKNEVEIEVDSDEAEEEEIDRDFPQFLDKSAVTEMVGFGFDRELEE